MKNRYLFLIVILLQVSCFYASCPTRDWVERSLHNLPEFDRSIKYGGSMASSGVMLPENCNAIASTFTHFCRQQAQYLSEKQWGWLIPHNVPQQLQNALPPDYFFASNNLDQLGEYEVPFVQSLTIPPGSTCCFMGDFHGSFHSLVRNLYRLIAMGYLDKEFKIIKKDFYIIFLGDYSDRGFYGCEVLRLVADLKLANWDHVFMVRGNHEDRYQNNSSSGLHGSELLSKGLLGLYPSIQRLYTMLPLALFIKVAGDNSYVQCCHGGVEDTLNYDVLKNECEDKCYRIPVQRFGRKGNFYGNYLGFAWNDFVQQHWAPSDYCSHGPSSRGEGVFESDLAITKEYMEHYNIALIMRGHQDMAYGCKMFFKPDDFPDYDVLLQRMCDVEYEMGINSLGYSTFFNFVEKVIGYSYLSGPYHWRAVVNKQDQDNVQGFNILNYVPVVTLSSAPHGRGGYGNEFPFDCFALVTFGQSAKQITMNVVERVLPHDRNNKYLSATFSNDDVVFQWSHVPEDYRSINASTGFNCEALYAG